jgi:hypothetical protein
MNMGELMREKMRGKMGIEKSIRLITLLTGLFRSTFFILKVIDGILSGHLFPLILIQFSILNLVAALYIGIYL